MRIHSFISFILFLTFFFFALINNNIFINEISADLVPTLKAALKSINFVSSIIKTIFTSLIIILLCAYFSFLIEVSFRIKNIINKQLSIIMSWVIFLLVAFSLNSLIYPFSPTSYEFLIKNDLPFILVTLSCALILLAIVNHKRHIIILTLILLCLFLPIQAPTLKNFSAEKNVIIVGVDSLRPDVLTINGFKNSVTPSIDAFINQAQYIPNVYTPVARTFVSWTSILTGKYPVETNARFNLTPLEIVDKNSSIAHLLSENGYQTVWAQDERRFNNIDESYGFQTIIGPPADAAEFLITSLNSIPSVSLFLNHTSLRLISPYIYNNRSAWWTYEPLNFVQEIASEIDKLDEKKPVFLATHLTLPHWPFKSARLTFPAKHEFDSSKPDEYLYLSMLAQADEQFGKLLNELSRRNILQNSIVIILSDHGESFGNKDDGPTSLFENANFTVNSQGHGTNVLSKSQFKVMLAFKNYSEKEAVFTASQNKNYSLIDVTPTLIKVLGLKKENTMTGLPISKTEKSREIYLESSINPLVMSLGKLQLLQTLAKGINFYTVAPNGKLIVKEAIYNESIAAKQRAIIIDEELLATFPDMQDEMIYVNLSSNTWQPASTVDNHQKIANMFKQLCSQYIKDVNKGLFQQCNNADMFLESIYIKWQH
ncbi:sulfatase-like hydrolase/transferase [Shewanella sp. SR44-4]|uniref:sulfatase-like hydrolase/transferase n=1 Tax=Shewanella sp. SR44-4 TaxID=2760935 RepID=UPI001600411C|nr:sulfatase-like hydrolase/transferase [Shewanella sp. SR44-4]MBB1362329.1 sulfatase-like hydrolase/transferase [Shewanella sp. SR44-4]